MVEKTLIDRTTRGIKMEKALDVALRYLRKIGPPAALLTFLLLSKAGIDWFSNLDPMFQPPISTPTLPTGTATPQPTPVSSPTPDWTPTTTLSSLRLVTNPFTHVIPLFNQFATF